MDFKILDKYACDAAGKEKSDISIDNPFREISFDGNKRRLGWLKNTPFSLIAQTLQSLSDILRDKKQFVFIGIGGSGNGIKTILPLVPSRNMFVIDSLDPRACQEIQKKIPSYKNTLFIPISKSGTTKETQLIAALFRAQMGTTWRSNFLWLADPSAFEKIDAQGWDGSRKTAIQFDNDSDIGGRFSCPHTLIFWLPLYVAFNKKISKLNAIYEDFFTKKRDIRFRGYECAQQCQEKKNAFLHPQVPAKIARTFSAWVVQLFQESLGSKSQLAVKTLEPFEKPRPDFLPLKLGMRFRNSVSELAGHMFFMQSFLVFYAASVKINFVNQDMVEKYKDEMRKLENQHVDDFELLSLDDIIKTAKEKSARKDFIEIVLYYHASQKEQERIRQAFIKRCPDKKIFVFIGSDWNHHSYQAAFGDRHTFFALLFARDYTASIRSIPDATLQQNVAALKRIGQATYSTIKDKALIARVSA